MKYDYTNISNTIISQTIDEWVHGERDRKIMKRRLIDCICYEPLADEFMLSERYIRAIVAKNEEIIYRKISGTKPEATVNDRKTPDIIPRFYCQTS
ncbi:MAG: hypothetical protein IJH64_00600 [Oscillospiraceae bacterium]|nr:hypothetical protein [Oscillospiraceae bacterium]